MIRLLHWLTALAVFGLFGLGLWMRSLDYYSPWYQTAPNLHKSIGIVLLIALLFRLVWRVLDRQPDQAHLKPWERLASHAVHWGFYALLLALMLAGYLVATVDGRPISVFGLVSVPVAFEQKGLEELAGSVHEYLAYSVIALAALHGAAALKHHFIDQDSTLRRMWSDQTSRPTPPKEEKELS